MENTRTLEHPVSTKTSWLQVQRTRIYYYGGTWRISANGNGEASQLLVPAAGPAPGTMPLEWRVSAMGNGECSPGSLPTLRGTLGWPSIY